MSPPPCGHPVCVTFQKAEVGYCLYLPILGPSRPLAPCAQCGHSVATRVAPDGPPLHEVCRADFITPRAKPTERKGAYGRLKSKRDRYL